MKCLKHYKDCLKTESRYRVSLETLQLVNNFKCLLPYAVLDIKDFLQFIA